MSLVCPNPNRDTIVEIYSDDRSLLPAPLNLTIPANQDKASFTIPIPPNAYPTGFSPMIVAIVDGFPPASERINIPGLNQNSASSGLPPSPNPRVNPSSGQTQPNSPNVPTIPQGLTPLPLPLKILLLPPHRN
ncbi:MAG: hypothetical protein HC796_11280 [Synechococcaceae cyanobacterium RL_1_2]|nr:hypothetical protein [Synechococcaceae cyanobacterium RL_1_2]